MGRSLRVWFTRSIKINKMKKLIFFLLLPTILFSQKYKYNESFIRDDFGKFNKININGNFEIKNDSVYLFNQSLKIKSFRAIQQNNKIEKLYTCTDNVYIYTFLLTSQLNLYFYDKDKNMYKFILIKQ